MKRTAFLLVAFTTLAGLSASVVISSGLVNGRYYDI
jgi:hypothetical protein